jgi:hypothetical protein
MPVRSNLKPDWFPISIHKGLPIEVAKRSKNPEEMGFAKAKLLEEFDICEAVRPSQHMSFR